MNSNGFITKVSGNCVEFSFTPQDDSQIIKQSCFEISRIRFGDGPAPRELVKPNTQIYIEVCNNLLKNVYVCKDYCVQVFYGQIRDVFENQFCRIGNEFFIFNVSFEKITQGGVFKDFRNFNPSIERDWYRIYTKSNSEVLEAQHISLNDIISVKLEDFNKDSMKREEVEMFHFKDSHSFSHFVQSQNVFNYQSQIPIEKSQVKYLIGTSAEILIKDGKLIAQIFTNNLLKSDISINLQSKPSICHQDLAKTLRAKKISRSIVSPSNNSVNLEETSSLQDQKTCGVNLKYCKPGESVYTTRKLFTLAPEIEGVFWVNSELLNLSKSISASFFILVAILEAYCRGESFSQCNLLIQDLENYINQGNVPLSYLEISDFLRKLLSHYEIQYKFIYLFEIIILNLSFFEDFANYLIQADNFDFFTLSRKFQVRFDVFEKISGSLKRKVFEFPFNNYKTVLPVQSSIYIYTDYTQLYSLYDSKQMLIDTYSINPELVKTCSILPNISNISSLFKESFHLLKTSEPLFKLQSIENQILILESLHQSNPFTLENSFQDLLLEAYKTRFEMLKAILNSLEN